MSRVRVCAFGAFRVEVGGGVLAAGDFPSRKAKRVCEMLAISGGRVVSKDHLIESLWGDRLPRHPVATLEHTVSILRSALATRTPHRMILTAAGGYQLNRAVADIDLVEFDELVEAAFSAPHREALRRLRAAADLALGEVLEDEQYAEWTVGVRAQYARRVEGVLLDGARLALLTGAPEQALAFSQRAQAGSVVPCEEAYHLAISALVDLGATGAARAMLDEADRELRQAFGVGLSPELAALRATMRRPRQLTATEVQVTPQLELSRPLNRLPFIGRQAELSRVVDAMTAVAEGATEFVLIEGPAGMGKSRLLSEIALSGSPLTVHQLHCTAGSRHFPCMTATRLYRRLGNALPGPLAMPVQATGTEAVAELFHRLACTIDQCAPLVVVIDDLHWADEASIAILSELTQPGVARAFGIIAAARPATNDIPEVSVSPSCRLTLPPLLERDFEGLGIVNGLVETGGHPGVLAACVQAKMNRGVLSPQAIGRLHERAHQAGAFGYQMLLAASALDQPFSAGELTFALGVSAATTHQTLGELLELGLLQRGDAGVYFTDDLTRRVLGMTAPHRIAAVRSLTSRDAQHTRVSSPLPYREAIG